MSEITHEIDANFAGRLNILRAGVLGANDGIISKKSVDLLFENEIVPILLPIFERIMEQKDIKITMKVIKDNFIFA